MDNSLLRKRAVVDYLSVRLRRIVRSVIERERKVQPSTWLAFLASKQYPLITKIFRSVAFIICVAMFSIQVYDRISYYLTSPIKTDVFIIKNTDEAYPDLTICHDPMKSSTQLFEELYVPYWQRDALAVEVITPRAGPIKREEMWKRINASEDIVSAKVVGKSQSENLKYSNILLLYGNCVTFHLNSTNRVRNDQEIFEILFSYERQDNNKNRIDYTYVHERLEHPSSRYEHEPPPGAKNIIRIAIRKYNFQYRKNQPCISSSEHRKCVHECFINYSKWIRDCRLPFQPIEPKLPGCDLQDTLGFWYHMQRYLRGQIEDNCTCIRKCSHRIFDSSVESMDSYDNQTVFIFQYGNPYITVINERFVYTMVNLLADIGGNSGLWIGLSVISVFDFLPLRRKPKKKHVFSRTDPLYRIVLKRIRKDRIILIRKQFKNTSQSFKTIKSLFVSSVCLLFAYAVYNRINLFFQYPVRIVVDISFMQTIHSPSLTICPGDYYLRKQQEEYAEVNNISDFCQVQIWHLLDLPNIDARRLWTANNDSAHEIWQSPAKPEYLFHGLCFNTFLRGLPVKAKDKSFGDSTHEPVCKENYIKFYIKPPTGYYDYFLYRYVMKHNKHSISYVLKRIAADQIDESCVSETNHESCKSSCLTRKLWQKVNCWLPFMPPSTLPLCKSSIAAKHSLQIYLELFVLPRNTDDCKCLPPCYKHIYEVAIEKQPLYHERAAFGFGTRHDIMETYRKARVYSVVTLLCDIGCWLGSTLGLCVFGVADVLINTAHKFKKPLLPREYEIRNKW